MASSSADRATSIIAPLGSGAKLTYKAAVFSALYELIQNLELPPGERLVEADLAARFGVSKTPVREALLVLERERLVRAIPHVGATVTWLSIPDYEQKLFILDALEQPAVRLVADRITREETGSLEGLLGAISEAHQERDEPRYLQLVMKMHADLFAAARYPQLTEMINGVQQSLRRYSKAFVHRFDENWDCEYEIVTGRLEHILRGDPDGAVAVVQRGHTCLLDFARQRVERGDPAVMPYMDPAEPQYMLSVSSGSRDGRETGDRAE